MKFELYNISILLLKRIFSSNYNTPPPHIHLGRTNLISFEDWIITEGMRKGTHLK